MAFALSASQDGWTPLISVSVNGREVAAGFYARLIRATLRDEAGQSSDRLTLDLDDAENAIALPPPKATIVVSGGLKQGGLVRLGTYELQSIALKGDAESGETISIQASGADLKRKLKGVGREHFEDRTVEEIVQTIAGRNGMSARVDAELGRIKLTYRARLDVSEIDFLTTLADEHDAVVKPMGDRLVMTKRGSGQSAGGEALPPILIEKWQCSSWEVSPEGRAQYETVKAGFIDQTTGKRRTVEAKTGLKGPSFTLKSPYPNEEQAQKAAQAEARRLTRNTGEGWFDLARGRFDAQAEAEVIAGASFREGIAGSWRADAVEHAFDENGWRSKVEVKSKEDGSSGAGRD